MATSSTMKYTEWEDQVRESIAEDWLKLIDDSESLSDMFNGILESLYSKYQPQKDGSWSASPGWQDMFNWTSCPLEGVRAVILLKRPKTESSGWTSPYKSNGYAGGVVRKPTLTYGQRISEIGTVWSMLEVARQCLQHPDADLQAIVAEKYQNGFNPEYLSQQGILFLNVALTTGHSDHHKKENSDLKLWQNFTLGLLDEMPGKLIPLFQWYITKNIEWHLCSWDFEGKFLVSKPADLDLGDGPPKHICYFKDYQISRYADELTDKRYLKHKTILAGIYQSIVCESNVQTYPATIEVRKSIKRYADEDVDSDDFVISKRWK